MPPTVSSLSVRQRHNYNTRLASKSPFVLPKVRTNYGKFNIRFFGPKVWNDIEEPLKTLSFQTAASDSIHSGQISFFDLNCCHYLHWFLRREISDSLSSLKLLFTSSGWTSILKQRSNSKFGSISPTSSPMLQYEIIYFIHFPWKQHYQQPISKTGLTVSKAVQ